MDSSGDRVMSITVEESGVGDIDAARAICRLCEIFDNDDVV